MTITTQNVLGRAASMLGLNTVYWAGAGGFLPQAQTAAQALNLHREWAGLSAAEQARLAPVALAAGLDVTDPARLVQACDCSGFVCWALGISRRAASAPAASVPDSAQWINTDSIWADAMGAALAFRPIEHAVPGCLVVYPKEGSNERFGHVAFVTEVRADGRAGRILHCSATNFGTPPHDAVKLTGPDAFEAQRKSLYAWYRPMAQA